MIRQLFQGRWLGHPIHPIIVHLPIAMFALSLILDIASMIRPGEDFAAAAFWSMGLGIVTALLAAVFGIFDYASIRIDHPAQNIASAHMFLNIGAVGLYIVNLAIRWFTGLDGTVDVLPFLLSLAGIGIISISGYLGGILVYDDGIGVGRHRRAAPLPEETIKSPASEGWADVGPDTLADGETRRTQVNGAVVTLVKHRGRCFAIQEFCTHRFGPLSEGTCHDGQIMCPWHRSCFDLGSGQVTRDPAKTPIRTFDLTSENGRLRVRLNKAE